MKRVWGQNIDNFAKTSKRKDALSRLIIEDRKKWISDSFSARKNTLYWSSICIFSKKYISYNETRMGSKY